jgi:hypothetical protein
MKNNSLSSLIDRIVRAMDSGGEDQARFLLAANQVPSTIGARVLFDPGHRRHAASQFPDDAARSSTTG